MRDFKRERRRERLQEKRKMEREEKRKRGKEERKREGERTILSPLFFFSFLYFPFLLIFYFL